MALDSDYEKQKRAMLNAEKDTAMKEPDCIEVCGCSSTGTSINISVSNKIDKPDETTICRKPKEDQIKILVVPEDGCQTQIIFLLPKIEDDDVSCTVEQLLSMLRSKLKENEVIDGTYLVNDPVDNVRYVVFVRKKINCHTKNEEIQILDNTSGPMKKLEKRTKNSQESSCLISSEAHDMTEVQCPDLNQCLDLDFRRNIQIIVTYPNCFVKNGITITIEDFKCLDQDEFLNDVIIDFYLKYFCLEKLSAQTREKTYIFSTFFYTRLSNQKCTVTSEDMAIADLQHSKVKRWTKNVNIFEKDFVIVPINEDEHWFLAIICYPSLIEMKMDGSKSHCSSKSKKFPCIVIFDSMPRFTVRKPKVVKNLRNYLQCEFKEKCNGNNSLGFNNVEVIYPDAPHQLNMSDCGIYLLQFVESFFEDVAEDSLQVLKKSLSRWFSADVIGKKRDNIKKLITRLATNSNEIKSCATE